MEIALETATVAVKEARWVLSSENTGRTTPTLASTVAAQATGPKTAASLVRSAVARREEEDELVLFLAHGFPFVLLEWITLDSSFRSVLLCHLR